MTNPEFTSAQPHIEYDESARKLTVRGATEFPRAAYELAPEIEVLDMSHNQLTHLPDDLARFSRMRVGFFSGNPLGEVPRVLADCEQMALVGLKSCGITDMGPNSLPANIKGIILTDNQLTTLPSTIGAEYSNLKKLMLTGNRLQTLPESLKGHKSLELLRVAANSMSFVPEWLKELPRLAWYSDAGNLMQGTHEITSLQEYRADDIAFGELLGESSKNQVYQATINGNQVAVKLFGKGITTDGLPEDDIQASLLAGSHSGLIGALGVYRDENCTGLVMPLIPASYRVLANPPDFATLTRDVYMLDTTMSTMQSETIARDVAEALRHLHTQGVMHGDVYAHNILVNGDGHAVLGDFGAASLYDPADRAEAWRQQLDVLGFGRLVEELARHTREDAARLQAISAYCTKSSGSERPTFAQLCEELA